MRPGGYSNSLGSGHIPIQEKVEVGYPKKRNSILAGECVKLRWVLGWCPLPPISWENRNWQAVGYKFWLDLCPLPLGIEFVVAQLKSMLLTLGLIDLRLTVEQAVLLSRLEEEYQVSSDLISHLNPFWFRFTEFYYFVHVKKKSKLRNKKGLSVVQPKGVAQ